MITYRIKRVQDPHHTCFAILADDVQVGHIDGEEHALVLAAAFVKRQSATCVHPPECVVIISEETVSGTVCYLCGHQLNEYPVDGDIA